VLALDTLIPDDVLVVHTQIVAKALGMTPRGVRDMVRRGELPQPCRRTTGRTGWWFNAATVKEAIRRLLSREVVADAV
jgi:hypothetical protein